MYLACISQKLFSETEETPGRILKKNLVLISLHKIFKTDPYAPYIKKIISRWSDKQLFDFSLSCSSASIPPHAWKVLLSHTAVLQVGVMPKMMGYTLLTPCIFWHPIWKVRTESGLLSWKQPWVRLQWAVLTPEKRKK